MNSHHDNSWATEAAPDSFCTLTPGGTAPYPATGFRIEVRDENFNLLSVHWSAAAALGETAELDHLHQIRHRTVSPRRESCCVLRAVGQDRIRDAPSA